VTTVGELLAERLAALGVERVWGGAVPGLPLAAVELDDPDLAVLLADAEGRLGTGYGAAAVAGRLLHLSSRPGGTASPRTVQTVDDLVDALAGLEQLTSPSTLALHLDLDLEAPVESTPVPEPERRVVMTLDPSFASARGVIVAGPGVVRSGSVAGLVELSSRTGWGIVNSWGAKGVVAWYDPVHFGTAGLQARDVELLELDRYDLVVATGLDPDELGATDLGPVLVQEVEPWQLGALTYRWERTAPEPPAAKPPLFGAVSAVVTPGYESEAVPLAAARAVLHLSGARPEGGVVVADPGLAGFWLARAYPTREVGSVVVPATRCPGFAVGAALVAGVQGRPAVAVVDGPMDEASQIVAEAAAALGVGIAVQIWGDEGSAVDADAHARVSEAQFAGERGIVEVPVRTGDLDALVAAAGPITAWGGLDG
jgi:hypothetical protein